MAIRTLSRRRGEADFTRSGGMTLNAAAAAVATLLRDPQVTDVILEDDAGATLRDRIAVIVCIGRRGAEPPIGGE